MLKMLPFLGERVYNQMNKPNRTNRYLYLGCKPPCNNLKESGAIYNKFCPSFIPLAMSTEVDLWSQIATCNTWISWRDFSPLMDSITYYLSLLRQGTKTCSISLMWPFDTCICTRFLINVKTIETWKRTPSDCPKITSVICTACTSRCTCLRC